MRTGRPPLPPGVLGNIRVRIQVQDGKHANGNLRWRLIEDGDEELRKRWEAFATYRDRSGKRRTIRRYSDKSGAQAKRLLQIAWEDTLQRERMTRPQVNTRIRDLASQWWEAFSRSDSTLPQTKEKYRRALDVHVIPTFGDLRAFELTTDVAVRGLEDLDDGARSRARDARVILKHVCTFAVRAGAMATNPITPDVPTYKSKTKAPASITPEQYRDIRQAAIAWENRRKPGPASPPLLADVLDLMITTGVRTGEALALKWDDVHLGDTPTIKIAATIIDPSGGTPVFRQDFPKTESGFRSIPIGSTLQGMLMRRAALALPGDLGLVFPNAAGRYLAPNSFRRRLRDALKAAGLEDFIPYLLRKTSAKRIRDVAGLEAASATLGHSSTAVTAKHYAGAVHDAPDVSDVMEQFLREAL